MRITTTISIISIIFCISIIIAIAIAIIVVIVISIIIIWNDLGEKQSTPSIVPLELYWGTVLGHHTPVQFIRGRSTVQEPYVLIQRGGQQTAL